MSELGEPQRRKFTPIGTTDNSYAPSVVGVPSDADQLVYNAVKGRWQPAAAAIPAGISRFFSGLAEARAAVADGTYVPTPGVLNVVVVLGPGLMVYDFDVLDFVNVEGLNSASNQASRYIELDGANDYISLPALAGGSEDVLDFSKDWSVGCTFVGVEPGSDAKNMCLFRNGGCSLNLKRGGTNWGLYITSDDNLYDAATRATANTWYAPQDFSRVLFTYSVASGRVKYYLGSPATGTYALRANVLIPASMVSGQSHGTALEVGNAWTGTGGSGFSGNYWDGGVNNLIISDMELVGPQVVEYFETGEAFPTHEYYADLTSYCQLGENSYPDVVDDKGNITGGVLVNGTADDFRDVPAPIE
tara:strand:- start:556 stop:1635 length:1080 start_codon:yes stop_codon:yes gene_type:complete